MATIYNLKPKFQDFLRPITHALFDSGVTANQVTVSAVILSIFGGALIYLFPTESWPLFFIPILLFIRMALNAIDGMLAREFDQKSSKGAILNELGDVISDTLLYLSFAALPGMNTPLILAVVLLSMLSEMTGVVAIQIGATRRYDGPMGKSDRAFAFGTIAFLCGIGFNPGTWTTLTLAMMSLLLVKTILNRSKRALQEVQGE